MASAAMYEQAIRRVTGMPCLRRADVVKHISNERMINA